MAGLRRDLGFVGMGALAASMMLGTGIFFSPQVTAEEFPSVPVILLLWTIGGLVALAGAWVFGRLAALHPFSGGPYVYVRDAYGPLAGFLFAWTSFIIIAPSSMAVFAWLFSRQVAQLSDLSPTGITLMALWSLVAVTFTNIIGVKTGGRVQAVLSGLKILLVAGLIALLFTGKGAADGPTVEGTGRLSIAFVGVLFAVGGWEYAVLASEEVRNPQRTIPRALFVGTAIVAVLYILVIVAYLTALGPSGVATANALAPEAAEAVLPGSSRFVALTVAISALGTLNAVVLLGPRATFAVARDGMVPASLARLSQRWSTPTIAIILQAILAATFYLSGTFLTAATFTVIGTGIFIVLSAIALPRLRRRAGAVPRRSDRWETAAAWMVAAVYTGFLILVPFQTPVAAIGFGLVAFGVVPYVVFRVLGHRFRPAPETAGTKVV